MSVKPILKMVMSNDLFDIEQGAAPDDPERFAIFVQCLIGEEGPAADTFNLVVLSPNMVAAEVPESGLLTGRGHLIMKRYDYARLHATVAGWCAAAESDNWQTSAAILSRYMTWEFEGD